MEPAILLPEAYRYLRQMIAAIPTVNAGKLSTASLKVVVGRRQASLSKDRRNALKLTDLIPISS